MRHGKPMTFAEIRAQILAADGINDPTRPFPPSLQRSLRRGLASMVKNGLLCAVGSAPYRYFIHPIAIGFAGENGMAMAEALEQAVHKYSKDSGYRVHF
jgi:hypothetical protein